MTRASRGPAEKSETPMGVSPGRIPDGLVGRGVGQVGILVPDLEAGLRAYSVISTVDAWSIWTYGPATIPHLRYRGAPARFSMRIALGGTGPQIELIQPMDGPNIYEDWLSRHGYGLHHLGFYVDSIHEAMDLMTRHGFEVLQSGFGYGLDGDGGFAYFDTLAETSVLFEAIEIPKRRPPAEAVWRSPAVTGPRRNEP